MTTPLRRPVSSRHAFALAFDLAVRRDALQSLVVPLLLRAPWIVALSLLPAPGQSEAPGRTLLLWSFAALGDTLAALTVDAMLRVRARSVFQMTLETRPPPALECYSRGLARVPWLFATELLRRIAIAFGAMLLVVPGVYFGYRLAFATEAVVLGDQNTSAAFRHSHRLTAGRFERWLELMVLRSESCSGRGSPSPRSWSPSTRPRSRPGARSPTWPPWPCGRSSSTPGPSSTCAWSRSSSP